MLHADSDHYFYGYTLNDNGVIDGPFGDSGSWDTREYGVRDDPGCPFHPKNGQPCYYQTDHFNQQAVDEMSSTPQGQPFYLQLDYTAPHGDFRHPAGPEPAPRHYDSMAGAALPHNRAQGFDEANVRDKPSFIRNAPKLTPSEIHIYRVYYQKMLESLRSIDDGVQRIVGRLRSLHRLGNTYILFVSDNGFFFGEHRLSGGKFLAYEPSTHLPFLMRGPGIKPGTSSNELVANIDIAPTVLQLAGVRPDRSVDGRSVMPFALPPAPPHQPADRLRVLRPDQRRRGERRRAALVAGQGQRARAGERQGARRGERVDRRAGQGLLRDQDRALEVHRLAQR